MRIDGRRLIARPAVLAAAATLLAAPLAVSAPAPLSVGVKQNIEATVVVPEGSGPFPGVVLIHAAGGLRQADLAFASELAKSDFVCLLPAYMKAYDLTYQTRRAIFTTDAEPIYADLASAVDTLQHLDKVRGGKVGAVGFGAGGYFAVWLAGTNKVSAAVAYYGDFAGAGTDKSLARFHAVFTSSSAPVLLLHGTGDLTAPWDAAQNLAAILESAHAPYDLELYQRADYEFDRSPSAVDIGVATLAWRQTVWFLTRYLR